MDNDYEKIKQSVRQATTSQAEITGQIKGKIESLNELGFNSEDPVVEADNYLNTEEPILDELESKIVKQKQEISDEYQKIIKTTAPGTQEEEVEND